MANMVLGPKNHIWYGDILKSDAFSASTRTGPGQLPRFQSYGSIRNPQSRPWPLMGPRSSQGVYHTPLGAHTLDLRQKVSLMFGDIRCNHLSP